MFLLPSLIILDHLRQQILHQRIVRMHLMYGPDRIAEPRAIPPRLRPRSPKPVPRIIPRVSRIAQPPHLIKLMPRRTTDRPIRPRPERPVNKLRKRIPAIG